MYKVKDGQKVRNVKDGDKVRHFQAGEILPESWVCPADYIVNKIVEEVKETKGGKK